MKIKSINFSDNTPSFWDNIMGWVLLPIGILLVVIFVLCLPFIFIYNFIRRKIFKIKDEESVECILFENEELRIVGDFIHPVDRAELPMIDQFFEALDYHYSEETIFQAQDKKKPSELGGCYFTDFSIDTEHHLYLQKIAQEEDEVKTYLVSFDKKTGKVEVIKEIGQYILEHYNEKTKTITGYGKEKVIHIVLE